MGGRSDGTVASGNCDGYNRQAFESPELLFFLAGLVALWVVTIAGEEVLFRGWMQTQFEACGRRWLAVLVPAVLFGLRHLPLDLYEGMAAWKAGSSACSCSTGEGFSWE